MNLDDLNPANYQTQLEQKAEEVRDQFADFRPPALEVFASEPEHYRMRSEFRVWHEGDDLFYIMFDKAKQQKVRCDQYLPASALINQLMPKLIEALRPNEVLRRKLFQVDFLSTLSGEILVSLLYHKPLDAEWEREARALKEQLSKEFTIDLIGRARKQKVIMDRDYVVERLNVDGQELVYQQVENSFTQPNGKVAVKMLEWAIDCTRDSKGDLLELYCGNGNFSLALAKNFDRVLATELAKPSVESAQYNIAENKIDNVTIIRMSAEDFSQAMAGVREFNRLKGVDLKSYDCNTILVDPPRAGIDDESLQLVNQYDNIVYISCNPDTLADNMNTLSKTHEIHRFALFDQFPYTHHKEVGVWLKRKAS
ncbi:tRNA (uridine(54)-C5)-methyltransferase TrmA [Paraferrimonas sedimenticola]|uniref:tRNA/tmRNA (uracil-C(5))-methyltransferase n=1 Tax=Paraferrimonas sedimenticola TaxID=375674 RepID=A0AA37RS26_9GAMM|nr:tRNA (uridine(54)-C5)-methyltransferase TrmA [Paraferrimonas sedimenticola]GLP95243.1 tRNA/tmRNA (uracil-C(5))-methyltransferase [Paraferrimonas sedimenticola]